jgi:hypothetical protein
MIQLTFSLSLFIMVKIAHTDFGTNVSLISGISLVLPTSLTFFAKPGHSLYFPSSYTCLLEVSLSLFLIRINMELEYLVNIYFKER